jgi:hypothetical protein
MFAYKMCMLEDKRLGSIAFIQTMLAPCRLFVLYNNISGEKNTILEMFDK